MGRQPWRAARRPVLALLLAGALLLGVPAALHRSPVPAPQAGPPTFFARCPGTMAERVRLPARCAAYRVLAGMTLEQRVGQLFMVGAPASGATAGALDAVGSLHVGSVMLTGRSRAGVDLTHDVVAGFTRRATAAATAGVLPFVATDQEGGAVQVLSGPGFDEIPSALEQGSWPPARVREDARRWGGQLRRAGVNVDLAPVLGTVPDPGAARRNPPVGRVDRQFGYTPDVVASRGAAFAAGMAEAGVTPTLKHFPGLGRVRANTDTAAGVTDPTTARGDAYLEPFAAALAGGDRPFLMMSSAYYPRIDPDLPAMFSPAAVGGLVRSDLGFGGVVISDDLGVARQVRGWPPGLRAVLFVRAGGDLVLTVDAGQAPAMVRAVLREARRDPRFRRSVDAAALRVLVAKGERGLLPAG